MVWPTFADKPISSATAFTVWRGHDESQRWLVTNWHVVTGRDPETGQALDRVTARVPDELHIACLVKGSPTQRVRWQIVKEHLYDTDGDPLWLEHPVHGRKADVVALPMTQHRGHVGEVDLWGYDPWFEDTLAPDDIARGLPVGVSRPLSIIGFPFGATGGGYLPIWIQGWVASELDVDIYELPLFLIDARTREGQSGSPVIAYSPGGSHVLENMVTVGGGPMERFLGVYSGRLNEESDIGRVWKRKALVEVLDGGKRGTLP
jgi:hypothetical protein